MMKPQGTVLLYNLDNAKGQKIRLLCAGLKLRVRTVEKHEYGLPLAALLGHSPQGAVSGGKAAGPGDFSDEMLVMAGLTGPALDRFLEGFKTLMIPRVALKAVVTPTNMTWNSLSLHRELVREHMQMHSS